MAQPLFAAVEQAVNASCHAVLSNAVLSYSNAGTPTEVLGILHDQRDAPDAVAAQRQSRGLVIEVIEGDLGSIVAGTSVTVRGLAYSVGKVERDKTGWVNLHLRSAA